MPYHEGANMQRLCNEIRTWLEGEHHLLPPGSICDLEPIAKFKTVNTVMNSLYTTVLPPFHIT